MSQFLLATIIFLFGLCVGSFLNAVIFRMEKGESALKGRSYCPHCTHQLFWFDLIPVLSFVLLQGKCRYCKKSISWQYPAVEIAIAVVFLLMFKFQIPMSNEIPIPQFLNFLYLFIVASLLIVIFVYDLKYYLIPDIIVYSGIAVAFLYHALQIFYFGSWGLIGHWPLGFGVLNPLFNSLASACIASAFFLAIFLLSRGRWLGFGDVKLAFFMGLFLGFPNILIALYSAFFAGAVVGIVLMFLKKKKMNSQVPFGPFLVGGTFVALFFGYAITNWYLTRLLV